MDKQVELMTKPFYMRLRGAGAAVAVILAVVAAVKDRKIAGLDATMWMLLSLFSASGVVMGLLSRILDRLEQMQSV
ncbi:MAG: hypothetical protein V1748_08005 [Actinomycetota bacterium]